VRELDSSRPVWINGERCDASDATLPIDDPALQAGLGLFETIATLGSSALDAGYHLERLAEGVQRLGSSAIDTELFQNAIEEAAASVDEPAGWLKLIWSESGRWFLFGGARDLDREGRPIRANSLPWPRTAGGRLSGVKSLNYGSHELARRWAEAAGVDEALWLDARGRYLEGSWSNLFVVRRGSLFTASLRDGILPGVMRRRVLEQAKEWGLNVHLGAIRPKRIRHADEVFVTSSLAGICPLIEIDGKAVRRNPGGLLRRLAVKIGRLHRPLSDATFQTGRAGIISGSNLGEEVE
jgi:branched-subunit amino acid aminotransferase/4-amino-4-deoxychorismate lyase